MVHTPYLNHAVGAQTLGTHFPGQKAGDTKTPKIATMPTRSPPTYHNGYRVSLVLIYEFTTVSRLAHTEIRVFSGHKDHTAFSNEASVHKASDKDQFIGTMKTTVMPTRTAVPCQMVHTTEILGSTTVAAMMVVQAPKLYFQLVHHSSLCECMKMDVRK